MTAEQTGSGAVGAPLPQTDEEWLSGLADMSPAFAVVSPTAGVLMQVEVERVRLAPLPGVVARLSEVEDAYGVVAMATIHDPRMRGALIRLAATAVAVVEALDRRGGAS